MYNRRYDKVFIFMKQEAGGYSIGERPLRGSCTLELKKGEGRLTIFVQDLKALQDGAQYVFCAISAKQSAVRGVQACVLSLDTQGNCEEKISFAPDNFFDTGKKIEDFNVFAILVKSHGALEYGLTAPLCGYSDGKINWKNRFQLFKKEQQTCPKTELMEQNIEESVLSIPIAEKEPVLIAASKEEVEEEPLVQKESTLEGNIQEVPPYDTKHQYAVDTFRDITKKFNREMKQLEQAGVLTPKEVEMIQGIGKQEAPEEQRPEVAEAQRREMPTKQSQQSVAEKKWEKSEKEALQKEALQKEAPQIKMTAKKPQNHQMPSGTVDSIFAMGKEAVPFEKENGCKWVGIAIEDTALLPYESCRFMKHPFLSSAYRKYNHFILGKREADGSYYFGVPDVYDNELNLTASRLGFNDFKPFHAQAQAGGEYGYWIKEVEAKER